MKQLSLLSAVALMVVAAACNKNEAPTPGSDSRKPLTFGTYVATAKANLLTSENITDFGVYAYYTQANAWSNSDTPNFMFNQMVSGTKDDGFTYSPVKFWPALKNAKITFFAYAPYGTESNGIAPLSTPSAGGAPRIRLASPDGACHFPDLVVAEAIYDAGLQETGGKITFQFHHVLSRINFQARLGGTDASYGNTSIYLNAVQLSSEYPVSGDLDLGSGMWDNVVTGRRLVHNNYLGAGENGQRIRSSKQAVEGANGCILSIPADDQEFILSVTYTVVTPDDALAGGKLANSYTINQSLSFSMEKGRSYDILLTISPSAIEFGEPEVSDWTAVIGTPGEFTL